MRIQSYEDFIASYGVSGSPLVALTKQQIKSVESIIIPVRSTFNADCTSHALYRCTVTCENNEVHLQLSGADINGSNKIMYVYCNLETGELSTSGGVAFKNDKAVSESILNMVKGMMKLPFTVGIVQFPFKGAFETGTITDYKMEPGTKLIIVKDSSDFYTSLYVYND